MQDPLTGALNELDQLHAQLKTNLNRLKADAYQAEEQHAEDPEHDQYWDGYRDALWHAIDVLETYED